MTWQDQWHAFADEIGGDYQPRRNFLNQSTPEVKLSGDGWTLQLSLFRPDDGPDYTQMSLCFPVPLRFGFEISPRRAARLRRLFQFRIVEISDPDFRRDLTVSGTDTDAIRRLLDDPSLRNSISWEILLVSRANDRAPLTTRRPFSPRTSSSDRAKLIAGPWPLR